MVAGGEGDREEVEEFSTTSKEIFEKHWRISSDRRRSSPARDRLGTAPATHER